MKNLKFESLDLDKFKENEIDHFKIGKIIGGTVYCQWNSNNGGGITTCDSVNWGSGSNGSFNSAQTAQDIAPLYNGCS